MDNNGDNNGYCTIDTRGPIIKSFTVITNGSADHSRPFRITQLTAFRMVGFPGERDYKGPADLRSMWILCELFTSAGSYPPCWAVGWLSPQLVTQLMDDDGRTARFSIRDVGPFDILCDLYHHDSVRCPRHAMSILFAGMFWEETPGMGIPLVLIECLHVC